MSPKDALSDAMEKVKVRNNTRRSLLVRVPGEAFHLQPGATAEMARAYLNTDELATLLRSGAVLLVTPPAASPPEAAIRRPEVSDEASAGPPPAREPRRPR